MEKKQSEPPFNRRLNIWRTIRRGFTALAENNQLDFFPLGRVLKDYNKGKLNSDLKAGLNVALLTFPQGMAYAFIAGIPIQYGVFGAAVASILGPIFSGSRFITLGPTNATAVLFFSSFLAIGGTALAKVVMMPLLLFMVGIIMIVGAYLRVANLIQYISRSVVIGYITGAAILIISNQVKSVLGFEIPGASTFYHVCRQTLFSLHLTHWPSVVISIITVIIYFLLLRKFKTLPNVAITLLLMAAVATGINKLLQSPTFAHMDLAPLSMLNSINAHHWAITIPHFNFQWISELASLALAISFLAILEGSSIGKSLAARSGDRLDTNQEMLSMGVANLCCGFLSGMPASGSLTRSTLNIMCGAATACSSIITGIFCIVGVFALGPFISYIPKASLAVLVISIGISLINRHTIKVVMKATRSDAIVFFTTFIGTLLFRLDTAIYFGAGISILLFLRKAGMPELVEYTFTDEGQLTQLEDNKRTHPEISIVHVEGELFFGAVELFRDQMRRIVEDPNLKIVVLKMRNAHHLDATSVLSLEELIVYMKDLDRYLLVSEARKDVIRVLKNSGLLEIIGRENIFPDVTQNPTLSTARALKRAQELLGDEKAEISIYVEQAKTAKKDPA